MKEDIREAVQANIEYLVGNNPDEVALFLESVAESLYDGELLEEVAAELRQINAEDV